VDVEVDHSNPLHPIRRGVRRRDRSVREQAEAAGRIAVGVVAGRADQGVGVADVARKDSVDRGERAAGGKRQDRVALSADPCADARSLIARSRSRCSGACTRSSSSSLAWRAGIRTRSRVMPLTSSSDQIRRLPSGVSGAGTGSTTSPRSHGPASCQP
jgi:hypothetical protein